MLCADHGLATAPDGRCVVCRREDRARRDRRNLATGAALVMAIFVVCGLAMAARLVRREAVVVAAARDVRADETTPSVDPSPAAVERTDTVRPQVAPPAIAPALVPTSSALRVEVPLQPSGLARPGASAVARSSPPPTGEQVQAALRGVPIVMFSTSWCPTCARARSFLLANGIRYTERDIDHDNAALEELKRRSGDTLIPTFDIDGKMLKPGFDSSLIASTLAASVEQRLGVKGIRVQPVGR